NEGNTRVVRAGYARRILYSSASRDARGFRRERRLSVENFSRLSAAAIASSVRGGEASPSDMIKASFARAADIGAGADALNIFLHSDEKASLAEAEEMQQRVGRAADVGLLAGVPVAIKDNIASLGLPTTCGSRILAGYTSPFEETAVRRLRANGGLIVAKTNMDEFAMGSSTENSAFDPTRDPHGARCVPGGSPVWSAAA